MPMPRDVGRQTVELNRRSLLGAGAASLMLAGKTWAQQFPIPTTPAEMPGPPPGTAMTKAYVQSAGRTAYVWGWPLVNTANRAAAFSKAPEPGLLGGVVPVAFGRNAMLTGYVSVEQHFIVCPNQDVVYGAGFYALDKEPGAVIRAGLWRPLLVYAPRLTHRRVLRDWPAIPTRPASI